MKAKIFDLRVCTLPYFIVTNGEEYKTHLTLTLKDILKNGKKNTNNFTKLSLELSSQLGRAIWENGGILNLS